MALNNTLGLERYSGVLDLDGELKLREQSPAPGTPAANSLYLYAKDKSSTSALYYKDDAGTEREIASLGATGVAGQITFFDTTSSIKGDTGLVWDNSNKRVSILAGASPAGKLHVATNDTSDLSVILDALVTTASPTIAGRGYRNSYASPQAVQANDQLIHVSGGGWNGTAYATNKGSYIIRASATWSGSDNSTYATIELTPTSSTTRQEVARFSPNTTGGVLLIGGGTGLVSGNTGIELQPKIGATTGSTVVIHSYGTGNLSNFQGRTARGIGGTPTASQADDVLVRFSGVGYGATAWAGTFRATIDFLAAENWTDAAQGTYIKFYTTPTLSAVAAERWRINATGDLIGTGSRTIAGAVASAGTLTLQSTTHATKGYVIVSDALRIDSSLNVATWNASGTPTGGIVFLDQGGAGNDCLIARDTSSNIIYNVPNALKHSFCVAGVEIVAINGSGISLANITLTGAAAKTSGPTGVIFQNPGGTGNDCGIWPETTGGQRLQYVAAAQGTKGKHSFFGGDTEGVTFFMGDFTGAEGQMRVGIGTTSPAAILDISQNRQFNTNYGLNGAGIKLAAMTFTYTTTAIGVGGTIASSAINALGVPTIAAGSTGVTLTDIANLYITAPAAGTNITITNAWGLWNVGKTRLDDLLDLSNIAAGSPNVKITATSDTPTVAFTDNGTASCAPTTAPAGFLEIDVGGASKYIPFWA